MTQGYVMIPAGSGLRWYNFKEKRPKLLAITHGEDLIEAPLTIHGYFSAFRCFQCGCIAIRGEGENDQHFDAEAFKKAV